MQWLEVGDEYLKKVDALDALIASLTARAAAQGSTMPPQRGQLVAARREGWIHLPRELPNAE